MRSGFTSERAATGHRITFLIVAIGLIAMASVTLSYADLPLLPAPAFLPAYASAVILTDLITAYLILAHAPLAGRINLMWLGAAYLFSGTTVIAQMLVFPGVWSEHGLLGAGPQAAVWLWVLWHGGFPALIIVSMVSAYRHRRERQRLTAWHSVIAAAFTLGLVTMLTLLVAKSDGLPVLISNGNYLALSTSLYGASVVAFNMIALVMVLFVTRGRTVLDLGLTIALLASVIDAMLTLQAGARFSLGWYIARVSTVISAFSVLAVYLREVTWLHARVIRLNARLEEQAAIDVITGLYNRRHFNRQLDIALRDGKRRQEQTSLLLIDIDHFKLYNDHYGHLAGDECLRRVAQAIAGSVRRPHDVAARFGGEEFAVILPATPQAGAEQVAAAIQAAIGALGVEHATSPTAALLTLSIGIGTARPGTLFEETIRQAEQALYAAKAAGRNRIMGGPAKGGLRAIG